MFLKIFVFRSLVPVSLALALSVPVLRLERICPRKGCFWPWPWIFFVSLAMASSLVFSASPLMTMILYNHNPSLYPLMGPEDKK